MTRLHLLLTIACASGAAAAVAPASLERTSPTATVAPGTARAVHGDGPADQVGWLSRYGTYNVREGSWNFLPSPHGC